MQQLLLDYQTRLPAICRWEGRGSEMEPLILTIVLQTSKVDNNNNYNSKQVKHTSNFKQAQCLKDHILDSPCINIPNMAIFK